MPRPKRWFPVSQDILDDAEFKRLCKRFGVAGIRFFLFIMSMLDRTDNHICLHTQFDLGLWAQRIGTTKKQCLNMYQTLLDYCWIKVGVTDDLYMYIYAPNYLKYRGNRAHEKSVSCSPPFLTLNRENSSAHHSAVKTPFPGDSLEQTIDDILKEKPWRNEQEEPAFERLWKAWPKKDHYLQAKIAWLEMRPTSEDYKVLLEQVAKREAYGGEWAGDNRRYCPQLAKYLREKRWKDGI